jgi:hypothetical protein
VTLTANAATGATFTGWSGACSGSGTTCTLTLDAAKSVGANFLTSYALTVSTSGNGTVISSPPGIDCGSDCSENYPANSSVTLTANAATGATFTGWSGACSGSGTTCTLTLDAAKSVSANFLTSYALTVSTSGNGTVISSPPGIDCGSDCSENYPANSSVTLTANAATGATFTGWSGACSGSGTTCTLTLDAAKSVGANFLTSYPLTVSTSGNGTVISSPPGIDCGSDCSENYPANTSVTLTASAATGTTFTGWSGACSGSGTTCTLTLDAAKSVGANFLTNYALTVSTSGNGTVISSPPGIDCGSDCSENYPANSSVTLTASAATGTTFTGWSGACSGSGTTCTLTLDAAKSVDANFLTSYALTVSTSGNGTVISSPPGIDCGSDCSENYPADTQVTLTASADPNWQFLGWGGACTGSGDCTLTITASTEITANFTELGNRYQLDSPVNGSFESGIGVVHGWVCEEGRISVQVDDYEPFVAAYGAERLDSLDVCGHTANGFAAAINWADYGDGEHTLSLLADGQPLTEARVTVTTLGEIFLTGRSAATRVSDFPAPGLSTPLAWSEPHQNFVVDSGEAASGAYLDWASRATVTGHWESPQAGGVESGRALVRGWACAVGTIRAELDGMPLDLPYGSEREDTLGVCNDIDNGYALAINWADYGDGSHQIRLLLDDVPIETRTFQIATPGGQGTVSGVQRQHAIADFPHPGDRLSLQWSEPHQNFRIIAYTPAAVPRLNPMTARCAPTSTACSGGRRRPRNSTPGASFCSTTRAASGGPRVMGSSGISVTRPAGARRPRPTPRRVRWSTPSWPSSSARRPGSIGVSRTTMSINCSGDICVRAGSSMRYSMIWRSCRAPTAVTASRKAGPAGRALDF